MADDDTTERSSCTELPRGECPKSERASAQTALARFRAMAAEVERLKVEVERLKTQLASTEASIRATQSTPHSKGGHGCGCGGYG